MEERSISSLSENVAAIRLARFAGSATAGVVETIGFHPIDTVVKRLMSHAGVGQNRGVSFAATLDGYSRIALRDAYGDPSFVNRYMSLFTGVSFAAGYKVLKRVCTFGGQPFVRDALTARYGDYAKMVCGGDERNAKVLIQAAAGSIVGVGEIVLLPLDVMKIKCQNNPTALRGRGLLEVLQTERISRLYSGAGWTAARNAPGSFTLFGVSALVKSKVFELNNLNDATFGQNLVASAVGGVASITIGSPFDVVKTRVQTRDFASRESGFVILRNLLRDEGATALFKGFWPKLFIVGPKLIFSFTIAQHMIGVFEKAFTNVQ